MHFPCKAKGLLEYLKLSTQILFWTQPRLLSNLLYYPSGEQLLCLLKANLSILNESLLAFVLCFISLVFTRIFMR